MPQLVLAVSRQGALRCRGPAIAREFSRACTLAAMTIYLVRHGRAAAGVEDLDPGLDDLGRQQAACVAEALEGKTLHQLVASPMRRTRETAAPLGQRLGLSPVVRHEVFDPAMPSDQRRTMIGPFMQSTWGAQPADLRAWRQRCVEAVLELGLHASAASRDLVVVSHYIAICAVIGEATDDDRVVPVPLANASISSFELVHGHLEVLAAGTTAHMPAELVTGINTAMLGQRP
jgi:broad specificity phosphatase PhoE